MWASGIWDSRNRKERSVKKDIRLYNADKETMAEIAEHVAELKKICNKNKMPFFISVAIEENGSETKYMSDILTPTTLNQNLTNDKITKMINVINGFDVVYPNKVEDVKYETIPRKD